MREFNDGNELSLIEKLEGEKNDTITNVAGRFDNLSIAGDSVRDSPIALFAAPEGVRL